MADPEALEQRITSRDVDLLRVQASVTRKAIRDLRDLETETLSIIRSVDPAEPSRRGDRFNRIAKVSTQFGEAATRTYGGLTRRIVRTQAELIEDESFAVVRLAQASGLQLSRTLTPTQSKDIASKMLNDGITSSDDLLRQRKGIRDEVVRRLRQVVVATGTLTDMVRSVRGERALRFSNGMFRAFERHAQSTVATGLAGAANAARYETYVANSDIVTMIQAINPLDGRTSSICIARGGRTWALRSGAAIGHGTESFPGPPPWHRRCRTSLIPLGRGDEPVRGRTFGGLLDSMSDQEQKSMLGPGKYELWRKGDIAMQDLIDQSGRPLSLAQLRERST